MQSVRSNHSSRNSSNLLDFQDRNSLKTVSARIPRRRSQVFTSFMTTYYHHQASNLWTLHRRTYNSCEHARWPYTRQMVDNASQSSNSPEAVRSCTLRYCYRTVDPTSVISRLNTSQGLNLCEVLACTIFCNRASSSASRRDAVWRAFYTVSSDHLVLLLKQQNVIPWRRSLSLDFCL